MDDVYYCFACNIVAMDVRTILHYGYLEFNLKKYMPVFM